MARNPGGLKSQMQEEKRGKYTFEDLSPGTECRQQYVISEAVYRKFLELFGDTSPLHVDDEVAKSCGFSGKLMHGAILNGFISNFVGTIFPGRRTLEVGVEISFVKPAYLGDVLELEATVQDRLESRNVVILRFRFTREKAIVARGTISVMICNL